MLYTQIESFDSSAGLFSSYTPFHSIAYIAEGDFDATSIYGPEILNYSALAAGVYSVSNHRNY